MTTRLRRLAAALSTLLIVSALFVVGGEESDDAAFASESSPTVGRFTTTQITPETITGGAHCWRGFAFKTSEIPTVVTGLVGGGDTAYVAGSQDFRGALYSARVDGDGNLLGADKVLVELKFKGDQQNQEVSFTSSDVVTSPGVTAGRIGLSPDTWYFLMQGRVTGSPLHYYVRGLDRAQLLENNPRFSDWLPNTGAYFGACNLDAFANEGRNISGGGTTFSSTSDQPAIGFLFETTASGPPTVATTDAPLSGELTDRGGAPVNVLMRYSTSISGPGCTTDPSGEDCALSGTIVLVTADPGFEGDVPYVFAAPTSGLPAATVYYYQARATNDAGTVDGVIKKFTTPPAPGTPTISSVTPENGALLLVIEPAPASEDPPVGATTTYRYRVQLSSDAWVDDEEGWVNRIPAGLGPLRISGLENNKEHRVQVQAIAAGVLGGISTVATGTPVFVEPPPPPPPPPATAPAPPRPTAAPVPPPVVQAPVTVPGRTTPVAPAPAPVPVTGPVLRGNVVPTAPQQPVARVGTRDIPVTTQVNTPNRLDVRASSVSLGVSIPQTVGGVRQQGGGPTELEVRSGGQTTLQGGGVLAGSTVQVFMPLQGDNAKQIAQIQADTTGTFNGDAVFATQRTEAPLPIGRQVLQIVSLDDTGQQVVMEMAVVIAQPPPAPEFDRSVDALPTLPPGQSIATEAGLPVQVAVRAETENRQAVIEADDWSMAISVAGQDASVEETPEGGASLTFVRDETASVQGSGFMPGTRADVWLFSEPTLLGTVTIDDNGEFNGEISVDGRIVTIGEHTLQLQGVGFDGYVRSANLGVVVKDADAEVATTADVAASFAWWFWIIGVLALLAVAAIAFWVYRRATSAI